MNRNTPSQLLREALLEYSREKKRSRSRREGNRQPPDQVDQTHENAFSDVVLTDKDDVEMGMASTAPEEQSRSTIGDVSSSFLRDESKQSELEKEKQSHALVESRPVYLGKDEDSVAEIRDTRKLRCCSSNPIYYIHPHLKDGDGKPQTRFIQKVFAILFLKAIVVLGWMKIMEIVELLENYKLFNFTEHYQLNYGFHYIAGGLYGIFKLAIRIENGSSCRQRRSYVYIIYLLIELILASDFFGCMVAHLLDGHFTVPRRVLYCIAGVYLFFIFVGFFVAYDMQDGIMTGMAFIITAICTIHQFIHYKTETGLELLKIHTSTGMDQLFYVLIVLGISEFTMMLIMTEMRNILGGRRYVLYPGDWLYTSIYII